MSNYLLLYVIHIGKHLAVLSHAASDHHKVLEENRKLYNQVQDLKGNDLSLTLLSYEFRQRNKSLSALFLNRKYSGLLPSKTISTWSIK